MENRALGSVAAGVPTLRLGVFLGPCVYPDSPLLTVHSQLLHLPNRRQTPALRASLKPSAKLIIGCSAGAVRGGAGEAGATLTILVLGCLSCLPGS